MWPHILLWGFTGYYIISMGAQGLLDKTSVRRGFGACTFLSTLIGFFILLWAGEATPATALPLHICTISGLIVPLVMKEKSPLLPFMYYIGLPCAIAALATPCVYPSKLEFALVIQFMAMHALIVLSVIWIVWVERREVKGIASAMIIGNVILVLAYTTNILTGGNYMYLAYAPPGTPLVWFGKPGSARYVAIYEVSALAVSLMMSAMVKKRNVFVGK